LNQLKSTRASILIPGHGQVQNGWEYVDTLSGLLQSVVDQTIRAVRQGLTLDEAKKRINLEDYRPQLTGENLYRKRAFHDFFVEPAVERGYIEAKFGEERGL